jgi:predicted nucleic acid-binding protein
MERSPQMKLQGRLAYVADASVVLKWYARDREEDLENALKIREDFKNRTIDLFAPELLIYEIANVLRYKETVEEKLILNTIVSIYEMRILRPVNQHVMEEAVRIARKYDITVYDSTYISFAKYLGCPLITADRKLLQKTRMLSHILSIDEY